MTRILFVLGVLGVMGLTSSFKTNHEISNPQDGGCEGGSRVCCASPGQNHF